MAFRQLTLGGLAGLFLAELTRRGRRERGKERDKVNEKYTQNEAGIEQNQFAISA